MSRGPRLVALMLLASLGNAAAAKDTPAARPKTLPYLAEGGAPETSLVLPSPPAAGTPAAAADMAAFQATRSLAGSPRWDLAVADVRAGTGDLLADFGCALGAVPDEARAPSLYRLFARLRRDTGRATNRAKVYFGRLRPSVVSDAPICVPRDDELQRSFSYPSGHATLGWTYGLVLAALAPDRAAAILRRARVYGESRIVCGVHWASDVEAGRTNATVLFAAISGSDEFRTDMDLARVEVATARRAAFAVPDRGRCLIEDNVGPP